MNIRHLDGKISFSDAPSHQEFLALGEQGYDLVLNNRPDEEEGEFLLHAQEKALAEQQDITYVYLPFTFDSLTWETVYTFNRLIRRGKKTLAHCRSGSRSVALYLLYELNEGHIDEASFRQQCSTLGSDADKALAWYARRQQHTPEAEVYHFYESASGSMQYVIADTECGRCAIIDPVMDFDRKSAAVSYQQANEILDFINKRKWQVAWILDTHPHADHFSAAAWLSEQTGAPTAIGEKVSGVQALWKTLYHLPSIRDPEAIWDALFKDGDIFYIGNLRGEVIFSPGHTLASVSYHIGNSAFIHDTLFMPDSGTARADFPGGSAEDLWNTIQRILALPSDTRLFTGHDYRHDGREAQCESTISEQKENNAYLVNTDRQAFINMRKERDATLPLPDLMLMALQININGGNLPEPEADGNVYLKIPLNRF
ncbi:uncharacterized protein (TIGR01244 family) [Pantoea sp. AN62]|uniref:bifunctional sulfur transferase/dioxygenase Blh n=1 Tax=unclassified Pantoea TaxID=2630326 RepID=UPI000B7D945C|nr:bifunctional sulfur transferase/dioxygenase Blh [Pantoea sp. AV62]OXM19264.1 MBL fold metallo-hydrolase [Pantoea sp. AV62]